MKIGVLQFGPELGEVEKNIGKANTILENQKPGDLDLLVLPELAFTGYNYPSLRAIKPFLEPTGAGRTATWAREAAARLKCLVVVGYPEICTESGSKRYYNALLTISPSGELVAHYRKTNLFFTDVSWCWPNPIGFETRPLTIPYTEIEATSALPAAAKVATAFGICMDFNPRAFTAPWSDYELASHVRESNAKLLVASNAWLTYKERAELEARPHESDNETLNYWLTRLKPLIEPGGGWKPPLEPSSKARAGSPDGTSRGGLGVTEPRETERIVVIANRVGIEPGAVRPCDMTRGHPPEETEVDETRYSQGPPAQEAMKLEPGLDSSLAEDRAFCPEARYAGSSCVTGLRGDGSIRMYGHLGRAEEKLLVVDTDNSPAWIGHLVAAESDADQ